MLGVILLKVRALDFGFINTAGKNPIINRKKRNKLFRLYCPSYNTHDNNLKIKI